MFKLCKQPTKEQSEILFKVRNKIFDKANDISILLFDYILKRKTESQVMTDLVLANTFKITEETSFADLDLLKNNFQQICANCLETKIYIARKLHPYFMFTDACAFTIPFMFNKPIVLAESCFTKDISNLTSLVAHEMTHSIINTKDYYMEKLPIKDAYAYEIIFQYE